MRADKFLLVADCVHARALENILKAGRPEKIAGKETPSDLNGLTLGELIRLQSLDFNSMKELLVVPSKIVLKASDRKLFREEAERLLMFSYWCLGEVKKISELFAKASVKPTPEEQEAGIHLLTNDAFTLVDYYALRMGYQDHAEVEKVPWIRVYRCYKADAEGKEFERRMYNVLNKKK